MTVNPRTITKMQELKKEGFSLRQIAKQVGVSLNTVMKYIASKDYRENTGVSEKKEGKDTIKQLEEDLKKAKLKSEVEDMLITMLSPVDDIKISYSRRTSLECEVRYLWDVLETTVDIEVMKWIEEKTRKLGEDWDVSFDRPYEDPNNTGK